LKGLPLEDTLPRKQKPTDFYNPPSGKIIASTEQCHNDGSVFEGHIKKGLTKHTLCGIVLFKLNTFFSHVFAGP
jgi:hypothetical protein